ncbi:MAG: penicillin-binding protein activator LpoB [Desulfobacterales bacterium]|nr:penicillin-binding protein activator LpoB [Desulfobacterales bacterium]
MRIKQATLFLAGTMIAMFIFTGCTCPVAPNAASPFKRIDGEISSAAMLPIVNAYEPEAAAVAGDYIETCLKQRNRLEFVDSAMVDKAVAGVNLDKSSGLSATQRAAIGRKLGVDYVLHGYMALRKTHTASGWRNDLSLSVRIYDTRIGDEYNYRVGKEVGSWSSRTNSGIPASSMDFFAKTLAETAAKDVCAKMLAGTY